MSSDAGSPSLVRRSTAIATALLAVLVALFSLRFVGAIEGVWIDVDPGIRDVVTAHPFEALTHILIAPVALLLGPFQFLPVMRRRVPAWHRRAGRVYVVACVIGGAGGLATAFHASGGPVAGWGFGILAVLWVATTLGAWWAAVGRNFGLHRLLMRFSYAMTFGAVTLRLQIPIGFMLGYTSYSAMSVWLAYTAWIPNVIVVALYTAVERRHAAPVEPALTIDGRHCERSEATQLQPKSNASLLRRCAPRNDEL